MSRLVDLLEIKALAKIGFPDLTQQRFAQVEELSLFKVGRSISVVRMKVICSDPVYTR
jgi:hypothetical protein